MATHAHRMCHRLFTRCGRLRTGVTGRHAHVGRVPYDAISETRTNRYTGQNRCAIRAGGGPFADSHRRIAAPVHGTAHPQRPDARAYRSSSRRIRPGFLYTHTRGNGADCEAEHSALGWLRLDGVRLIQRSSLRTCRKEMSTTFGRRGPARAIAQRSTSRVGR